MILFTQVLAILAEITKASPWSFLHYGSGVGLPLGRAISFRSWAADNDIDLLFDRALQARGGFVRPLDVVPEVPSTDEFFYLVFQVMTRFSVMVVISVESTIL
ncbi:hypothetical protein BHM03_00026808 [Ensete ventricosum]|nr:hypothetical protein BHM03_00026808 [Ensete ventricosum]